MTDEIPSYKIKGLMDKDKMFFYGILNFNKAWLFEGNFQMGRSQHDNPFIFQEERI